MMGRESINASFFANKVKGGTQIPVFLEPSHYVLHPESSQDASPGLKTNTNQ